ncbi:MAG: hypothetical protein HZC42_01370 [Candidatus Eisenbacteria bacterium]|nr:hypothetical protein [Candidatus Eisenbacteria bacterium]
MPSPADGAGVEVRVPADTTRPAAPSRAEAAGVEVRVPADTTHAAAPSRADAAGVAPPAAPDTARVAERTPRRAARDSASFWDQPRWVMLRSVALPGWGQLHNGSWLKALVLGGGEIALGVGIVGDWRSLDRLSREAEAARVAGDRDAENAAVAGYNRRLARVVGREWLLGGWMVYTLMDAYVDANFRGFHVEFKHDPALPEGAPAPAGVRLSLRWDF